MTEKKFKQLLLEELDVSSQEGEIVSSIDQILSDLSEQEQVLQKVIFLLTSKNAPPESTAELMNIYTAYKKSLTQIKDFIR